MLTCRANVGEESTVREEEETGIGWGNGRHRKVHGLEKRWHQTTESAPRIELDGAAQVLLNSDSLSLSLSLSLFLTGSLFHSLSLSLSVCVCGISFGESEVCYHRYQLKENGRDRQEAFMAIGVLALQGSFNEHITALNKIGVKGVEIRKPEQLEHVRALIIPGGESTTMAKLAEYHNLFPALRSFIKSGKPVWGTCAGLIFLADRAVGQKLGGPKLVGGLDCLVHRNFFGSQIQSFETELSVPTLAEKEGGSPNFRGIFIRAPAILEAGPSVEVLADYPVPSKQTTTASESKTEQEQNNAGEKVIVVVKQGNLLATAFHPELTADTRWHSFFLKMVDDGAVDQGSADQNIAYISKQLPVFQ